MYEIELRHDTFKANQPIDFRTRDLWTSLVFPLQSVGLKSA